MTTTSPVTCITTVRIELLSPCRILYWQVTRYSSKAKLGSATNRLVSDVPKSLIRDNPGVAQPRSTLTLQSMYSHTLKIY